LGIDLAREGFFVEKLAMYPAIGQGAVALQCRSEDAETRAGLEAINHRPTWLRIVAERELLRLLDGDCQMPVGVRTELRDGALTMEAVLFVEGEEGPRLGKASGAEDAGLGVAAEVFGQIKI
jgi:hydroxymethylbilane synthase